MRAKKRNNVYYIYKIWYLGPKQMRLKREHF